MTRTPWARHPTSWSLYARIVTLTASTLHLCIGMNTTTTQAVSVLETLRAAQVARVAELEAELAQLVADGDEYHAAQVRGDIVAASSLARLVHPAVWS